MKLASFSLATGPSKYYFLTCSHPISIGFGSYEPASTRLSCSAILVAIATAVAKQRLENLIFQRSLLNFGIRYRLDFNDVWLFHVSMDYSNTCTYSVAMAPAVAMQADGNSVICCFWQNRITVFSSDCAKYTDVH